MRALVIAGTGVIQNRSKAHDWCQPRSISSRFCLVVSHHETSCASYTPSVYNWLHPVGLKQTVATTTESSLQQQLLLLFCSLPSLSPWSCAKGGFSGLVGLGVLRGSAHRIIESKMVSVQRKRGASSCCVAVASTTRVCMTCLEPVLLYIHTYILFYLLQGQYHPIHYHYTARLSLTTRLSHAWDREPQLPHPSSPPQLLICLCVCATDERTRARQRLVTGMRRCKRALRGMCGGFDKACSLQLQAGGCLAPSESCRLSLSEEQEMESVYLQPGQRRAPVLRNPT